MDMTTIAAFVAFIAMVVAWMAAPTDAKLTGGDDRAQRHRRGLDTSRRSEVGGR